jgi:hypothetical protein
VWKLICEQVQQELDTWSLVRATMVVAECQSQAPSRISTRKDSSLYASVAVITASQPGRVICGMPSASMAHIAQTGGAPASWTRRRVGVRENGYRNRVPRTVQRIRRLRRPPSTVGHLRPVRPLCYQDLRRALVAPAASAVHRTRPRRRLLVGHLRAPGRVSQDHRVRAPRHARSFFEALAADDIGRPDNMEIIFNRQIRPTCHGVFRTTAAW